MVGGGDKKLSLQLTSVEKQGCFKLAMALRDNPDILMLLAESSAFEAKVICFFKYFVFYLF